MGGKRWTNKEKDQLIKMNHEGFNYAEIANKLGRSHSSCQQMGIKNLNLHGDMNIDENFFSQETEEKYYILGYWLADGCIVNKGGGYYFYITSIDKDHLENIAKIMMVKRKVCKRSNCNAYDLVIGNKRLVKNLMNIGGKYRKTKTMTINDITFEEKYFYTLLRGFFDGDGGYQYQGYKRADGTRSISAIKFTGSKLMIKSIYDYLGYGVFREDSRKNNCYYLSFYGDKMRMLLHKMYDNSTIYLERKYKIYEKSLF